MQAPPKRLAIRHHQSPENHDWFDEHRGKAFAAGRAHSGEDRKKADRSARLHRPDQSWRKHRHARARQIESVLGLPELGFFSDDQDIFERLLRLPDGILLVTGPTGSGKTSTLYACLNYINKPDRKIITVEEPVEYQMNGINQVQVNADIGMTFPAALRSILRQAPNIIMIGEIRDLETASIATNASLTGHLVFSTLHTNDAPSAVARLVDIGVQPFLVASSVRAIMAQRLVRRLVPELQTAG